MTPRWRRALALLTTGLLGAGIASATPAAAATTTQLATADTMVNGDAPTTSFGTNTTMRVDDTFPKISYVKFAAPSGTITDAKLRLYGTGNDAVAFKVHTVPSTWTNSTTYNTRPTLGAEVGSGTFVASGWTTVDVDAGVTSGQVVSLAIVRTSAGADTILSTSETANEPELVIETGTTPPPTLPDIRHTPGGDLGFVGDRSAADVQEGEQVQFFTHYTVGEADTATGVTVTWYIDDVEKLSMYIRDDTTLGHPMGDWSASSTGTWTATPGAHTLKVVYDKDATVAESNETNNTSSRTFTVAAAPPPANEAPTVNAGTDATITLPSTASLDGTVNDPDSTETTAWSKVSGPGTVTFGNSSAVDTTATFSSAGTYVLRLTANDGVNAAVTDDVQITVNAEPTPPPTGTDFDILGLTESQIDSIPTSGAAWTELLAMADDTYNIVTNDGNQDDTGNVVAGALVYVRTGTASYKTKVENALAAAQNVTPANWQQAAANRKLGGLAAAGQLIGKPVRNTDGSLNAWGSWLNSHITVTHSGGVARNQVLIDTARGWDNNHGAAARQSLAAIEAYLDLSTTTSCNAMKAWLGGTHSGYAFVNSTSPGTNQMGWTDNAASWYDSNKYAGINPANSPGTKPGAIPSDTERDGATYPSIGSAGSDHYIFGNLYREVAAMVTLSANGCILWDYADSAAKRARVWADTHIPDPENVYHGNADAVFADVYGLTGFGTDVGPGENFLAASEWLTSSSSVVWPIR